VHIYFISTMKKFEKNKTKMQTIIRKTGRAISTSWIPDFIFMNSQFKPRAFPFSKYGIHEFTIQLHEFTTSASRINDFNFMNSRFQLHEFTISTSWIHDFNFTNSISWLHDFNFTNSRFQLHEFLKLKSRIHKAAIRNSWNWNVPTGLSYYYIIVYNLLWFISLSCWDKQNIRFHIQLRLWLDR
jgi:hypothetical protein